VQRHQLFSSSSNPQCAQVFVVWEQKTTITMSWLVGALVGVLVGQALKKKPQRPHKTQVILVDMDNVLADFDSEFVKRWKERHPEQTDFDLSQRKYFELEQNFSDEEKEEAIALMSEKGI